MKALTLYQPWASFVMAGLKEFETRGWSTTYRGRLAIHAGTKRSREGIALLEGLGGIESGWEGQRPDVIEAAVQRGLPVSFDDYPRGVILGTVQLVSIWPTVDVRARPTTLPIELALGDFSDGRFAWALTNRIVFQCPVPAVGHQQLWEWKGGSHAG